MIVNFLKKPTSSGKMKDSFSPVWSGLEIQTANGGLCELNCLTFFSRVSRLMNGAVSLVLKYFMVS